VKEIVALPTLRTQLTGILSLQPADTNTSIAYTGMPDNGITGSTAGASNSSATATTTTMSPVRLPDE